MSWPAGDATFGCGSGSRTDGGPENATIVSDCVSAMKYVSTSWKAMTYEVETDLVWCRRGVSQRVLWCL